MFVHIAAKSMNQSIFTARIKIIFVLITVRRRIGVKAEQITSPRYVRDAAKNMKQINTNIQNTVRIAKIEEDTHADVFNMEVDGNHNFSINGGLIVHNCMDETRYFVKSTKIAIPKNQYISHY